jgi:hypothetical protein
MVRGERNLSIVMPGLDPGIHVFIQCSEEWQETERDEGILSEKLIGSP